MSRNRPLCSVRALLLAVLLLAAAFSSAAPAGAATNPAIKVSAISWSTSSLTVRWSAPAGVGKAGWSIYLKDSAGRTWPASTACAKCRSTTIDGLLAGMRYQIQVVGYGTAPAGLGATVGMVRSGACSGVSGTCVTVGSTGTGALAHNAQGFLHGTTTTTSLDRVGELNPTSWRIGVGDFRRFGRARQAGGSITVFLSDSWRGWADRNGLVGQNPWADWDKYREYVQRSVQWHVDTGNVPEYWEIQNEPDYAGWYTASPPVTRSRILEQLRVAHDAIRSVLPDARIVGPSLGQFRFSEPTARIDLRSFLDYAVTHDLKFDVAWHELGNGGPGTLGGSPRTIYSHVQTVRAAIADRGLEDVRIHINEYGARWNFDQPGARVGYIAALEASGADVASMACWPVVQKGTSFDTCFSEPGLLDGLFSPLGLETDTFSIHSAYAAMSGRRLATSTTDAWTSALAAVDSSGTVRAMIGRHQGCTVGVDQGCPTGSKVSSAGARVTVALPAMTCASRYDLTVQRVTNLHNALRSVPTTVVSSTNRPCGASTVSLPGLTDGSAYLVVARPR